MWSTKEGCKAYPHHLTNTGQVKRYFDLAEGEDKTATGCFIKGKFLENSIMTPMEHEQAKQGNCPKCSGILKSLSKNQDVTIKHCEPCNRIYVTENKPSFKQQYLGEWKVDERGNLLHKRLSEYYKTSEHMDNREAAVNWREFKKWCYDKGYTVEEINRAKQAYRED